jgi:hypothetical protein
MAEKFYALIKDSIVTNIVVFDDPTEELLSEFKEFHEVDEILVTPHALVAPGWTWEREQFVCPQPFPSWTINWDISAWEAPIPEPQEEGKQYTWNEATQSWDMVVFDEEEEL